MIAMIVFVNRYVNTNTLRLLMKAKYFCRRSHVIVRNLQFAMVLWKAKQRLEWSSLFFVAENFVTTRRALITRTRSGSPTLLIYTL